MFLCFIIALGWGFPLIAQEAQTVLVVAVKGQLMYQSPGDSMIQEVFNGAVLQIGGTVRMAEGKGEATLFADGRFQQVKGSNPATLLELFPNTAGMLRLNFDATFGEYLMAATNMAANPGSEGDAWASVKTTKGSGDGWAKIKSTKEMGDGRAQGISNAFQDGWGSIKTVKGTGDGWGTVKTTKGTGDGWGGKGSGIQAIHPYGKVRPGTLKFIWSKPAGNPVFKLEIRNSSGTVILETTTQDTFWTPVPDTFPANGSFEWNITASGDLAIRSNTLIFEIAGASEQNQAFELAEKAPLYKQSTEEVRQLMRAVALEREAWFVDAATIYRDLQKAHPGNQLIRIMHAAFWMRQGIKPLAEQAYSR